MTSISKLPAQFKEDVRNLLMCMVCTDSSNYPTKMCMQCSKLFCTTCISKCLEKKSACPHCRVKLRLTQLVDCKWIEDVCKIFEKVETVDPLAAISDPSWTTDPSVAEFCDSHELEKMTVYCVECAKSICYKCALWGKSHSGHSFQRLDEVVNHLLVDLKDYKSIVQIQKLFMEILVKERDEQIRLFTNLQGDLSAEIEENPEDAEWIEFERGVAKKLEIFKSENEMLNGQIKLMEYFFDEICSSENQIRYNMRKWSELKPKVDAFMELNKSLVGLATTIPISFLVPDRFVAEVSAQQVFEEELNGQVDAMNLSDSDSDDNFSLSSSSLTFSQRGQSGSTGSLERRSLDVEDVGSDHESSN